METLWKRAKVPRGEGFKPDAARRIARPFEALDSVPQTCGVCVCACVCVLARVRACGARARVPVCLRA